MAQVAYQGHVTNSTAKASAVTDADNTTTPSDRANYTVAVAASFSGQPGAAARAQGYPRAYGK